MDGLKPPAFTDEKDSMNSAIPPQPIQLVAVDLDGTLLNSQHEMTPRTESALKAAMSRGVKVVIATGKTIQAADHLLKRLGVNSLGIFNQGTVIYNADGSLHSQQTLEPGIARQVITFAEDRGHQLAIYSGSRILTRQLHDRIEELTTHYHEPMPEVVGPLQNMVGKVPVNKIIAIYPGDGREIKALRWQLTMQLNGSARIMSAGIPDEMEILPAKASKGSALKALLKEFGIPTSQVMAIGDGENDIEMLQLVGLGVAVGNAGSHVKEVAKVVVASNDEDGVAEAIERFVLNARQPEAAVEAVKPTEAGVSSSNGGSKP
jgi:Cof subfamily protein (haloacid dehalogenase superfamily)